MFTVAAALCLQQMNSFSWFVQIYLRAFCVRFFFSPLLCVFSGALQEEDFQEMVNTAHSMETQYGHLFEKVIVNDDLSAAFSELRTALKKVETETQWVPVSWTHS